MPLNSCFRAHFANKRVKVSKTLRKSSKQHFYANIPLFSKKLSWVLCLLVGSESFGPLFNTLTAAHMHSSHNSEKLGPYIQPQLLSKPSTFSASFISFSKSTYNFEIFEKKSTSQLQYVRSYCFQKMSLLECPKAPVLECPLQINVLRGPKHCGSLYSSTFMLMFH